MDEAGNHHSQQTNTGTENQTLHVLTNKLVLNNGHREGNITHWVVLEGEGVRGEIAGRGDWGGITLGEILNVDDRGMDAGNHHSMCTSM